MKKATLILLLTIPFIVFGQSWKDHKTSWKDYEKEYHFDLLEMDSLTFFDDSKYIVYLKETMEPLHGMVYVKYDNGFIAYKGLFVAGLRPDGINRVYHANGKLAAKVFIKNGKEHGLAQMWHENGRLQSESNNKNGKIVGLWRIYYENGQLKKEYTMKEDEISGLSKEWHENGQLKSEGVLEKGIRRGLWKLYDENGNLTEQEY